MRIDNVVHLPIPLAEQILYTTRVAPTLPCSSVEGITEGCCLVQEGFSCFFLGGGAAALLQRAILALGLSVASVCPACGIGLPPPDWGLIQIPREEYNLVAPSGLPPSGREVHFYSPFFNCACTAAQSSAANVSSNQVTASACFSFRSAASRTKASRSRRAAVSGGSSRYR